ncbi:MAG: hypothetical protein MUF87_18025 [Anaerolineae bacterium]|nr:hypothetical protein [Anaerolineae bacterium]
MKLSLIAVFIVVLLTNSSSTQAFFTWGPFATRISANTHYVRENRIATFRPSLERYSVPIHRVPASTNVPYVEVVNEYSGRTEWYPIPTWAQPATGSDRHLLVIKGDYSYEMWNARWVNSRKIIAGGIYHFPFWGNGITADHRQRVNSGGWSTLVGMVTREDFLVNGRLVPNRRINHALVISLPRQLINQHSFVYPAVAPYTGGTGGRNGIANGERLAIPRNLNVDALNVHPFTRELLRAARDYGLYVNDANGAPMINGKYVATIRVEPGLIQSLYGVAGDTLTYQIGDEIAAVIAQHGIFRVR